MTDKKIQTTLVIRGDSKDSIRQLNLTGKELDALLAKQQKSISINKRVAEGYGKVTESLSRYAMIGGGAVVAAGVAMVASQLPVIGRLGDVSDQLQIASDKLVGYRHAADVGGVGNDAFDKSLQTMAKNIGEASMGLGRARVALDELGLSNEEFFALGADEQFEIIVDRISALDDVNKQAALSSKIFGGAGVELLNTINMGSEGIAELARQTEIAGTALTRLDAMKVEQADDAMQLLKMSATGFAQQLTVAVAPALKDVADRVFMAVEEVGGMGVVAEKSFGYVITAAGFVGDAFRGVKIIAKTLELGVASIATAAIQGFGLIIEGYTNLANLIPGIQVDYDKTAFGQLEHAVTHTMVTLNDELQSLMLETIPSQKLDAYVANVTRAATLSADAAIQSNHQIAASTDEATDSAEELDKIQTDLIGRYHPLRAATERYKTELERLGKLQGIISDDDYAAVLAGIEKAYVDATKETTTAERKTKDLIKQADPLAKSYEEALKRVDASFAKAWANAGDGFESLADELKGSMKDLLGELAHQAITQPIIMQLGFVNSGGGLSGGRGASPASIAEVVASLAQSGNGMGVSLLSGINNLGGGSGIPGLDSLLERIPGSSNFVGPVQPASMASSVASFAKSLGAGMAGQFAGGKLGEALFGKQANSDIGATIGGVIGSAAGPLGAFIGAGIGSMIDVMTGGDGKQRTNAGFFVAPTPGADSDRTFSVDPFASGLAVTGFARRADQEAAVQVIDTFRAVDETASVLIRELGGVIDLTKATLNGLDEEARAGSKGTFLGLGGNGALEGDINAQLKWYIDQLIGHVSGLDAGLLDTVRSATSAEEALTVLSAALAEKTRKDQEQIAVVEETDLAEQELHVARLESVNALTASVKNAMALQRSIRDQSFALQGIAVIGDGITGSIDDQIQHIVDMRELAVSNHQQQLALEQELFERRRALTQSLTQYAVGLQLSDKSTLGAQAKLALAESEFMGLAGRANDANLSSEQRLAAAESLQGAGDVYLDAARTMFASSAQYEAIFENVLGVVTGVAQDIDPGAAFDPGAANQALLSELNALQSQLTGIIGSGNDRVIAELKSINGSISKLSPDLAAAITSTMGVYMTQMLAAGKSPQVIADTIPKGSLAESAADKWLAEQGIKTTIEAEKSSRNDSFSSEEIAAFVREARASAESEADLIKRVYEAAQSAGIGSGQLAQATGLDQQDIIDAAVRAGYGSFSGGGIAQGPASGHLNILHGTEAVVPIPNGFIPVQIQGAANDALVTELRTLNARVSTMTSELEGLRTLTYAAAQHASDQRGAGNKLLSENNRRLNEVGRTGVGSANYAR